LAEERPLFVARSEDLAQLDAHWAAARTGQPRVVRLVAPFGGGRRALVAELFRTIRASSVEHLPWRVSCTDQDDGFGWIVRMYGSLVGTITSDPLLRGKVEMILNGQLPNETKRVQGWFQAFTNSLREAKADPKTGQIQLQIPQDNPLIALVEIVRGIARKLPIVLEMQHPYMVGSIIPSQFFEAILSEAKESHLLAIAFDEPDSDVRRASHPAPLIDLWARRAADVHEVVIAPWGAAEAAAFLESKELKGNAARLAEISAGRPGFLAELVEILVENGTLDSDLDGVTLASLTPQTVDEDELDLPTGAPEEGKPKHAGPEDADRVAYFAALLGQAFPSQLVAEMGGFDRESIDDLMDAMPDLFEEVQFQEEMQTWIYRFKRGCWREGILALNDTADGHQLARNVAVFMERFLAPRGVAFMTRTARLYAEHGAPNRAANMRAIALTNDQPNSWGLAYEIVRYFDEVPWTDATRRTVSMTLLDHLAGGGQLAVADRVHTETTEWATAHDDRELLAWLLLNGAKLDLRRQDLFRARDRARDALKLFEVLGNTARIAETHAQLAAIALADGKPDEAVAAADASVASATVTGEDGKPIAPASVTAQAEMVRGVVARRSGKIPEAIEHFKNANEAAGGAGLGPLALDAGLSLGEALLASQQLDQGRDVLRRVANATRQLGQGQRERAAVDLLGQIEASLRNFPEALQLAQRALQLSQQLKIEASIPVDLYRVGSILLAQNQGAQALPLLQQAEQRVANQAGHPLLKDLWYTIGLAARQAGQPSTAREFLQKALQPLGQAGEARKLLAALDNLAAVEAGGGNLDRAKKILEDAVRIAGEANLKDEKHALEKRLQSISG
jgi:tetratricopeptide (TPR) repeat protein